MSLEWKISSPALSWGSWTESRFIVVAAVPESHLEMFRLSLLPAAKACVGKRKNPAPDLKDGTEKCHPEKHNPAKPGGNVCS